MAKTIAFDVHAYLLVQIPKVLGSFNGKLPVARLFSNLGNPEKTGYLIEEAYVTAAIEKLVADKIIEKVGRSYALVPPGAKAPDEVLDPEPAVDDDASTEVAIRDPKEIAAENFKETLRRLDIVKSTLAKAKIDMSTPAGDKAVRETRTQLVRLRTATERHRLAVNQSARDVIKANDELAKTIFAGIAPIEERYQLAVTEKDEQIERDRAEKLRIANEAAARVTAEIDFIRMPLADTIGKTADELQAMFDQTKAREITTEVFGNRYGEAIAAKDYVMQQLLGAIEKTRDFERQQEELRVAQAKQVAEADARRNMAEMREQAQTAVGAGSDCIGLCIELVERWVPADHFTPLQEEGAQLQTLLLGSLKAGLVMAKRAEEQQRKDDEEREEARRKQVVEENISAQVAHVNGMAMRVAAGTPDDIAHAIEDITAIETEEPRVATAKASALAMLNTLLDAAERRAKDEEDRIERERVAKEKADEEARVEALRVATAKARTTALNVFENADEFYVPPTVAQINERLEAVQAVDMSDAFWGEQIAQAVLARKLAIGALTTSKEAAIQRAVDAAAEAKRTQAEKDERAAQVRFEAQAKEHAVELVAKCRLLDASLLSLLTADEEMKLDPEALADEARVKRMFQAWRDVVFVVRLIESKPFTGQDE